MDQGTARARVVDHVSTREVISRTKGVKRSGKGWVALCPAHDDRNPSLSISEGAEGRTLLNCQAGCSFEAVCAAMGVDTRSLGPDVTDRSAIKTRPRIIATYDYVDEQRNLLFQAVRFDPKGFRPRMPDGKGDWVWSLAAARRVLYRLPEILTAGSAVIVFAVEGEKDADKLAGLGLLATTNVGGAGKWRNEYNECLRGRHVVILPDNDKPGCESAEKVARSLYGIAASVRVLLLPKLPDKGDVSDWIGSGGTADLLVALAKDAPLWKPGGKQGEIALPDGEVRETDLGNARRLVRLHGCDLRYCFDFKKWFVWDSRRWRLDSMGETLRRAKNAVGSIYSEAREADGKLREQLAKWAITSEADRHILAMVSLAQSEPSIPIEPKQLDTDAMLLNCANGTLDLRTGELREHRREDYITRLIDVQYQESAECPAWFKFLDEILDGNAQVINFLGRAVGYSLTGNVSERVVFILYGTGANGKSVFIETIQALLSDYAMRTPTSTLLAKRDGGVPNDVARLKGARFVTANESEEGKRLAEAEIKDLSGGDTISARFMRSEFFDFKPEFKIWFRTNHKPVVRDTTDSIWDRLILILFGVRIPERDRDKRLGAKLAAELPGILAWAVRGCLEWQGHGLQVPAEVKVATEDYRSEMDTFGNFIQECCLLSPDCWTQSTPLREAYEEWAKERGEHFLLVGNAFTQRLRELGCIAKKQSRTRGWKGIGLLSSASEGDTGDTGDTSFTISK